ncbi:DUF3999 family protein [Robertkochia solimangrovi]|uniref:DUF3999 family protein n=1 Tax=Robertkochia solimangrovi TaxID=2213046 RepID=UPI001180A7CC|nr:DUF3999 family protein [Robertkochia solimangrovi]TRZ41179.1 DUF3999 domain-containing protein [Robertkochia solimangrovi]
MTQGSKLYLFLFLLTGLFTYGQFDAFGYKRSVQVKAGSWQKIALPDAIYGRLSEDLTDLRIYGLSGNDTLEVPYRIVNKKERISEDTIGYKILNRSRKGNEYYFTFEISEDQAVNFMDLNFSNRNFDWSADLEGSNDQKEWYTILEDQRMLSIKNSKADYRYTTLNFPDCGYKYYRLSFQSDKNPGLLHASLFRKEVVNGEFKTYKKLNTVTRENRKSKHTDIDVTLKEPVPVSRVRITVADTNDYYRQVVVRGLSDSIRTQNGWVYTYKELASGTLSSMGKNDLEFDDKVVKKLKITIQNNDNAPLVIRSLEVEGNPYALEARFAEPADYYLVYGGKHVQRPEYDIRFYEDNIPDNMPVVIPGLEEIIKKDDPEVISPLIEHKYWLWLVMGLIVLTIGGFTLRMMKGE